MSSTAPAKRVAIIGGGILGVSTAVHLLREGASVILLTERGLASEASGRSLSWLNSAGERSTPYHQLRVAGVDRYRTLFAADPGRDWLQFGGGLMWNAAGQRAVTEARHAYEKSIGYDSKLLAPEQISSATPGIDANAVPDNAIFNPGEGWVSLPDLVDFLMEEFHARGGELVLNAGKVSVTVDAGRTTGVETAAGGTYEADAVLVACGAATPAVVAPLGVEIPNGSPVSMLVLTKPVDHKVKAVMNTPRAAVRPNPGSTFALDHDWYEGAHHANTPTAPSASPMRWSRNSPMRHPSSSPATPNSSPPPGKSATSPSPATASPSSVNSARCPAASSPSPTPGPPSASSPANFSRARS